MINEARLLETDTELEPSADSSLLNDTSVKNLSDHVLTNYWCGIEAAIFNKAF